MKNKLFCIANWKMYLTNNQVKDYLETFSKYNINDNTKTEIVFCPSPVSLSLAKSYNKFNFGAQNFSEHATGPYTGEVSLSDVEEIGCKWVVLGHSERRTLFNETNKQINKKMKLAYNSKLTPILCIGEDLDQMNSGKTEEILSIQITEAFKNIKTDKNKTILLAYEPVWSIGTGVSADLDIISNNVKLIKNIIKNNQINCNIHILYGGSVNNINASSIINLKDIDGFLIGSSSIEPDIFYSIYKNIEY